MLHKNSSMAFVGLADFNHEPWFASMDTLQYADTFSDFEKFLQLLSANFNYDRYLILS